jgi:hypothetical protein
MNCGNNSLLTNYIDFNIDIPEYRSVYVNYFYVNQMNVESSLFKKHIKQCILITLSKHVHTVALNYPIAL